MAEWSNALSWKGSDRCKSVREFESLFLRQIKTGRNLFPINEQICSNPPKQTLINTNMILRYVELNPSQIYNRLGIDNQTCWGRMPEWHDTWWTEETIELRKQFANAWMTEFDKTMNHFNHLRESIAEVGILSPISIVGGAPRDKFLQNPNTTVRGHIPPQYYSDYDSLLMTQPFGGSRITIAEELGVEQIPCAVYDFSNRFPDAPQITQSNFREWFGPQYMFCGQTPNIRDGAMNNNHRQAQQNAHKVAREAMNV